MLGVHVLPDLAISEDAPKYVSPPPHPASQPALGRMIYKGQYCLRIIQPISEDILEVRFNAHLRNCFIRVDSFE